MDMNFDECERRLRQVTQIVPREMLPPINREVEKMPTEFPVIPLSDEQRRILEQPVDSRVHRILNEIEKDQKEIAKALGAGRIIPFPFAGSRGGHAVRDCDGHWTILSGPPPEIRRVGVA
jgi:hypothetical protein